MRALKREREELDKKIEALAKQGRDQLIGNNATKVVIVKGDKRMIIPRSQLMKLISEDKDEEDIKVIKDPKSLHDSDMDVDEVIDACFKCGRSGVQLWRKELCFERFPRNPKVFCIKCLSVLSKHRWCTIQGVDHYIWHPAIPNNENASMYLHSSKVEGNEEIKQKFEALPE